MVAWFAMHSSRLGMDLVLRRIDSCGAIGFGTWDIPLFYDAI
jgi:hypothetical protein